MARQIYIIGNWKMHQSLASIQVFFKVLKAEQFKAAKGQGLDRSAIPPHDKLLTGGRGSGDFRGGPKLFCCDPRGLHRRNFRNGAPGDGSSF